MLNNSQRVAAELMTAAPPVIDIYGMGGRRWKRNVPDSDSRRGPWWQLDYRVLDRERWSSRSPCLYLVSGGDGGMRYVGVSKNRSGDRWRISPAIDAETMISLPEKQLFHSQCMKHIQREFAVNSGAKFRVHILFEYELLNPNANFARGLSCVPRMAGMFAEDIETWLCSHKSDNIARWNVAKTGRRHRTI
jgi:hypothetical protein